MEVAIVKYNAGNIQSVLFALERIGVTAIVTDNSEQLTKAEKVIFPGVGEASTAMKYLREKNLDSVIKELKQPVLGICLGMQLLCASSEENNTSCIGVFDEPVKRFSNDAGLKVPQIGWNNIYDLQSDLFESVTENSYIYLVHSFYAAVGEHTIAKADYPDPFSVALHKNNFYGVQFHPEKSAEAGERILRNFLQL
jgi:glutamine amidotransferase